MAIHNLRVMILDLYNMGQDVFNIIDILNVDGVRVSPEMVNLVINSVA